MPRRIARTAAGLLLFFVGWFVAFKPTLHADDGGVVDNSPSTTLAPPVITAVVTKPGTSVPGGPPVTVAIPCSWRGVRADQGDADAYNLATSVVIDIINTVLDTKRVITVKYYSQGDRLHRWSDARARFERQQRADCSQATARNGVSTGDTRWVAATAPSPMILLAATTAEATEPITAPVPSISPPDRSPVNLGLWLAVEPVGPISVRAELGPLWAETTATMVSTSFDPGNGDRPVVCAGNGTPIPDDRTNSIDQGPCGYTYRADTNGATIDMSITSTWTVRWSLSDGTTGDQADIVVTTLLPYEVYEIQTVGIDG